MSAQPDKRIAEMHKRFGIYRGVKCGGCCNCASYTQSRKWYKCLVYGFTNAESTDWRISYNACGHYGKPHDPRAKTIADVLKHEPRKKTEAVAGQMGLFAPSPAPRDREGGEEEGGQGDE